MSGFAFVVLYVSVTVVVAAIWMVFRPEAPRPIDESDAAATRQRHSASFLSEFAKPYRASLVAGSALIWLTVGTTLAAPWSLVLVIDHGIGAEPLPPYLTFVDQLEPNGLIAIGTGAGFLLLAMAHAVGRLARKRNDATRRRMVADIEREVFVRLQDGAIASPEAAQPIESLGRVSDNLRRIDRMLAAWFDPIAGALATVVVALFIMAMIEPTFALAGALVVFVLAAASAGRRRRAFAAADTTEPDSGRHHRFVPPAEILFAAGLTVILYLAATQAVDGAITLGELAVLLAYAAILRRPVGSILDSVATMAHGTVGRQRLAALLSVRAAVGDNPTAHEAPHHDVSLRMHDVAFGYDNTWPVLRDVNLLVLPGELVCVVGAANEAKASLLGLVVRAHDPATGAVELGGTDVRDLTVDSVRSRIAVISGDLGLIDGTVAENIAFGSPDATPAEVDAAAQLVRASGFVRSLPGGFETLVGSRGAPLAAGERRLLALARAVVRNTPIVVVDDPTAGLHASAAARIREALLALRTERAALVVTSDLELADAADRVYVLEDGVTVEYGAPHDLLRQRGRYAGLRDAPVQDLEPPATPAAFDNDAVPTPLVTPVATTDMMSKVLAQTFADVVGRDDVSPDSDFFDDLGADSMVLARFCARLRKTTDLPPISMKQVYEHPTITSLAESLGAAASAGTGTAGVLARTFADVVGRDDVSPDSDFFDDLGADSMVLARFCARLRKTTDLPPISMKQVYEHPTITSLAESLAESFAESFDDAAVGEHEITEPGPVPAAPDSVRAEASSVGTAGYLACGALQLLTLLGYLSVIAFGLVSSAGWIGAGTTLADRLLRTAIVGNALVLGAVTLPIVVKWVVIGRWRVDEIRIWSLRYYRFWLVKTLVTLNPIALFAGSPVYVLYLKALGARIGRNVLVLSRRVPVCTDLLTIGDDTVVRKDSLFTGYRAHDGVVETGTITLGRAVVVGELTVIDINTSLGDAAQLGHSSSLVPGQDVPAGEHRCGTPAHHVTEVDYGDVPRFVVGRLRKVVFSAAQLVNWVVFSSLAFGVAYLAAEALAQRSYFAAPDGSSLSGWTLYAEGAVIAALLLLGVIVARLIFVATVPRLLHRWIDPQRNYPLYGWHYMLHRGISRATNVTFFMHLFGDSSYVVPYLRWLGYDLSDDVVQTGSNFGSAVKHDNPYLVSIGRGTMIADGLSLINADYSSTGFRLSPVRVGADNFLGNQVGYPSQGKTGDNCLLATKVMVPLDGETRTGIGLLGAPSFRIPRSVMRDQGLHHPEGKHDQDVRLAAKSRHNLVTISLFLLGEWAFLCTSIALSFAAVIVSQTAGPLVLAAAALLTLIWRVVFQTLLERTATRFRPLQPQQCSIYEPYFWFHERYWKLAVRPIHLALFAGTTLKTALWRLMGVDIGRRVFDDGCVITERTLVSIGDRTMLNAGSVVQSHSQEDGGFKSDRIVIGSGCTVGTSALVHYGATMGDGAALAAGSFLMKGSEVPPHTRWEENPARQIEGVASGAPPIRNVEPVGLGTDDEGSERRVKQLA